MSRLVDADAAIDFVDAGHLVNPNEPRWSDNEVVAFLKSRPTIDAVPRQKYEEDMENAYAHGYTEAESNYRKMIEDGELVEVVRCKDCRWGEEKCGNIECNADLNVPSEYHGYDWFCPNGERRSDGR